MVKFSKLCSESFHRLTDRRCYVQNLKCRKIFPTEIGEIVRYSRYQKQFQLPLKFADRAQSLPGPAPNIWLIRIQISSKSVHFWRSYSRSNEGRSFAP